MLIWGAKSQAQIYHEMLVQDGPEPRFIFDPFAKMPSFDNDCTFLGDFVSLEEQIENVHAFIVAIGDHHGLARWQTISWLISQGLKPHDLFASSALIEPSARFGASTAIMAGAVVHHFVTVGDGCILNTGCLIDHETVLGHGVHVMGGASIAGRVSIGDFASIGTNATVLPEIKIGRGAYVGAGAVVVRDVEDGSVVVGNPAVRIRENRLSHAVLPQTLGGEK